MRTTPLWIRSLQYQTVAEQWLHRREQCPPWLLLSETPSDHLHHFMIPAHHSFPKNACISIRPGHAWWHRSGGDSTLLKDSQFNLAVSVSVSVFSPGSCVPQWTVSMFKLYCNVGGPHVALIADRPGIPVTLHHPWLQPTLYVQCATTPLAAIRPSPKLRRRRSTGLITCV